MKKEFKFAVLSILFLSLILSVITFVSAEDVQEQVQELTGVNPEAIPSTPEDVSNYLVSQWSAFIAKTPFIGSIHTLFIDNPLIFKIAFGEPYSFSPSFLFVLILWIFFLVHTSKAVKSSGLINEKYSWIVGLAITIIIAQIQFYHFIASGISNLAFSQEAWWARTIIFAVAFIVIMAFSYLANLLEITMRKSKENKEKKALKRKVESTDAFVKGAEEGKKITEPLERTTKDEF